MTTINSAADSTAPLNSSMNWVSGKKRSNLLKPAPRLWPPNRPMMKAKNGSIINMSSIIGEMGNAGQSSYAASKAGIIGFTQSVAKELGSRNIRCNAIAPGFVETDMTSYLKDGEGAEKYKAGIPLGRFASGEDIANVALFLASDWGNYITGQTISACGGLNI